MIKQTTKLQQYLGYLLFAVNHFQKHGNLFFDDSLEYFESHRRACIEASADIGLSDTPLYTELLSNLTARSAAKRSTTTNNNNKNTNYNNNNTFKTPKHRNTPSDVCGRFNSFAKCTVESCVKKHVCSVCSDAGHNKPNCPKYLVNKNTNTKKY